MSTPVDLDQQTADSVAAVRSAIEARYRERSRRSAAFHEDARRVIPSGTTRSVAYYAPYPLCIASGRGCRVRDLDGNEYLDHLANFGSMIHGHAHPEIAAAVRAQLERGTDFGAPNEPQLALAREIARRVPSVERIRFTTSGTEANLYAIRAARAFTGKSKLLKMEGSYHGGYDSVAVSVDPGANAPDWPVGRAASRGLAPEVVANTLVAPFNDLERTADIVRRHKDELAAVILECVTVRGMIAADRDFVRGVREATRDAGVLLILDEVVTLRLAPGGAQSIFGIAPDLTSFGKIIGGGLPVGAFGGRADVMGGFDVARAAGDALPHAGTFAGNAAVASAGLASLGLLTESTLARVNALGDRLRARLRDVLSAAGVPAQVTGVGSLVGVHFTDTPVRDYRSSLAANREAMRWLHLALINRGIFARATGAFFLSTPMNEADVDATLEAFRGALKDVRLLLQMHAR
jgi:glutamate-1-semialdehyde 2,1-aminomutase